MELPVLVKEWSVGVVLQEGRNVSHLSFRLTVLIQLLGAAAKLTIHPERGAT